MCYRQLKMNKTCHILNNLIIRKQLYHCCYNAHHNLVNYKLINASCFLQRAHCYENTIKDNNYFIITHYFLIRNNSSYFFGAMTRKIRIFVGLFRRSCVFKLFCRYYPFGTLSETLLPVSSFKNRFSNTIKLTLCTVCVELIGKCELEIIM